MPRAKKEETIPPRKSTGARNPDARTRPVHRIRFVIIGGSTPLGETRFAMGLKELSHLAQHQGHFLTARAPLCISHASKQAFAPASTTPLGRLALLPKIKPVVCAKRILARLPRVARE